MTLREKRHLELQAKIDRATAQRDRLISRLASCQLKIGKLRRSIKHLGKEVKPLDREASIQAYLGRPAPVPAPAPAAVPAEDLTIPDFLKRQQATKQKDAAAAESIREEQATRKTTKARVRIEKMKAKQSGDLKKIPLTGKAALNYIKTGSREG